MKYLLLILSLYTAIIPHGICSVSECCSLQDQEEVVEEEIMTCSSEEKSCCSSDRESDDSSATHDNCKCCATITGVFYRSFETENLIFTFVDNPFSPLLEVYHSDLESIWIPPNILT